MILDKFFAAQQDQREAYITVEAARKALREAQDAATKTDATMTKTCHQICQLLGFLTGENVKTLLNIGHHVEHTSSGSYSMWEIEFIYKLDEPRNFGKTTESKGKVKLRPSDLEGLENMKYTLETLRSSVVVDLQ